MARRELTAVKNEGQVAYITSAFESSSLDAPSSKSTTTKRTMDAFVAEHSASADLLLQVSRNMSRAEDLCRRLHFCFSEIGERLNYDIDSKS